MFRVPAISLIFLITALMCGCGNNPHPPPERTVREDGQPWAPRYVWYLSEPKSLDPQNGYDTASRVVLEPVYDTLLEYEPWKTEPFEVMPGMLTAMPEKQVLADGRVVMTCHLKKGITFHDDPCFPGGKGREVVAEDVHFSFQRICDPKIESPFYEPLAQRVLGMREARETAANAKFDYTKTRIPGFEVIDTYNFRIHMNGPYPQLLYWFALHTASPMAPSPW